LAELEEALEHGRLVAVCRELTKVHEQVVRGTCAEVRDALAESPKGEITVIVEGRAPRTSPDEVDVEALVAAWQAEGLGTTEMAKRLRDDYGWKRADAYQRVVQLVERDG
jgi:16S rRNA (cytidine1402-2'-O)-methyltransferase